MALRRLIIGIAVLFSTTFQVSSGWGYTLGDTVVYNRAVEKSLERLDSLTERMAIKQILADLEAKSYLEILVLKLALDVCQEIACRTVSTETARRYVEAYANMRVAVDAHETALRNAAAAERSVFIAAGAAIFSLLSLSISALSYRRTFTSAKRSIPA